MNSLRDEKCSVCGKWENFSSSWINVGLGLCPGHDDEDLTAIWEIGSRVPRAWISRGGTWYGNPDCIAPVGHPEPIQYGQALVSYELC